MSIKASILRKIYWVNDFLHGSPVRSQYRDIRKKQTDTASIGKSLAELLEYAASHCEFYRAYKGKSLADFPVVNKNIIRDNMEDIRIPEEENPWQDKGAAYHIQRTSGSTGAPFAIPQDSRKRRRRIAELKYTGELLGFRSHDELVQLRIWTKWQSKGWWQRTKENIFPFDCSNLNEEHLAELCRRVAAVKAKSLRGYSSSFELLARHMLQHGVTLPTVKVIIAGAETLYDSTRQAVAKAMPGCHIVSQYANEECGIMAQERPGEPGIYHFNRASYIFEVLKPDCDEPAEDGELGRIIVTDMYNYACPVIRYDTGDMCVQRHDGHGVPYIEKLYGRRLDMLFNTLGEPVFPMYFARVLKNYDRIAQWQFIQRGEREYLLKLSLAGSGDFKEIDEILPAMRELLGEDAEITVEYVDEIPVLGSGKRKCVVNEWKKL
ncbi:MAG: hypothetical protein MJ056_02970 [Akkermansia sp.]|nr:hypothetical protein [Akkermansia sp.]